MRGSDSSMWSEERSIHCVEGGEKGNFAEQLEERAHGGDAVGRVGENGRG